jgi:hypothetical protein
MQPSLERDELGRLPGGVFRYVGWQTTTELLDLAALWGWHGWRLQGESIHSKPELIEALTKAVPLPAYQGRNWDALEESLRDLSWTRQGENPATGYLLVWSAPYALARSQPSAMHTALSVLQDVSDFWAQEGVPFCVLFRRTYGVVGSLPPIR